MNLLMLLAIPLVLGAFVYAWLAFRVGHVPRTARIAIDPDILANLPDRIRLVPLGDGDPHRSPSFDGTAAALLEHGFEYAGAFAIDGIADLRVRLLANSSQSLHATLYDHVTAGSWFEFVTQYPGGERSTFTTNLGFGCDPRPGQTVVCVPGADPLELYARAISERRMGVFKPVRAESLPGDFENGYAAWMAWHRAQERVARAA